jgi:hypothetical protein
MIFGKRLKESNQLLELSIIKSYTFLTTFLIRTKGKGGRDYGICCFAIAVLIN